MKRWAVSEDIEEDLLQSMARDMYGGPAPQPAPEPLTATAASITTPAVLYPEIEARRVFLMKKLHALFKAKCEPAFKGNRSVRHFEGWLWMSKHSERTSGGKVGVNRGDAIFPSQSFDNAAMERKLRAAAMSTRDIQAACQDISAASAAYATEIQLLQYALSGKPANELGHWKEAVNGRIQVEAFIPDACGPPSRTQGKAFDGGCIIRLTFKTERMDIRFDHYVKLLRLYRANSKDKSQASIGKYKKRKDNLSIGIDDMLDGSFNLPRASSAETDTIFCCLARYFCAQGAESRGGSNQAAAPEDVFIVLAEDFGVYCELFASPLNVSATLATKWLKDRRGSHTAKPLFCGAFPDIDSLFGAAQCDFFSFTPTSTDGGSFWVNPPFEDGLLSDVLTRLEELLENTMTDVTGHGNAACMVPLSFMVIMPYCPEKPHHQAFASSMWCERHIILPQEDHCFYIGAQHIAGEKLLRKGQQSDAFKKASNHSSSIFVLRNTKGKCAWPCTDEKVTTSS